ncbi:hypothetical protein [Mesorhizobium sp. J8]|uniref:hypothetical protein n=1 Tax=Mesorhizobium sp. J8 TaxID=2777475 RepID=UPI00191509B6|nr:hypothetical protein [Mesorhizobium sp. J8]
MNQSSLDVRSEQSQNVKPEAGVAAVVAESLSRLASVGLQYGFFIGCLDPVDDETGTATMPRIRRVKRSQIWPPPTAAEQPGEPMSAPAGLCKPMLRLDV